MKTDITMRFAGLFSYINTNTCCVDLGGNVVLRIGSLGSPNGRIYFTDNANPPNDIRIPAGITVTDVTRNRPVAPVFLHNNPFGDFIINYPTNYEITFNNQVVVRLINQEQSTVEIANNLDHFVE
ncbi:hypothetical protein RhiirA4_469799 [Rhizophagus irregularis]|uniref:Uncharacterized protein n=1 Tax=Rhizophagus irregularis TaxID=588596 RepID=A0A2I1H060_9GLOM|nr:hypothetical protein RhiirA4_469799 [Rhizophagus irregularis]